MFGRLRLIKKLASDKQLDALLVSSLPNIRYLTGFAGSSGLLLLLAEEVCLFTDFRYKEQVKEETTGCSISIVKRSLLEDLAASKLLKGRKRLGFESQHLPVANHTRLRDLLPKIELVPCEGLVESLRLKKESKEIEKLSMACSITDSVFKQVLGFIRPGIRELEVAAEIERLFKLKGGSGPSFPTIVASGPRSALPHAASTQKKIASGDLLLFDMGAVYDGYCSDLSRTVVMGRATARQRKIYSLVLDAQETALSSVRRGMRLSTLDGRGRMVIKKAGYAGKFGHSLGHGVGIEVHELPAVSSKNRTVIEKGMVFTVEPGVYIPGWGGVRIEDMVAVTEVGPRVLTQSPKELIQL